MIVIILSAVLPSTAGHGAHFNTIYGSGFVSHICLNDRVVEGLELLETPVFSVQYHPEAAAGPHDASYLFDQFVNLMERSQVSNA